MDFSDNEHLEAAIRKNKHKLLAKKVSVARSDPSKGKKNREAGSFSKDQGIFFGCYLTANFSQLCYFANVWEL